MTKVDLQNWWERHGGHHRGASVEDARKDFLAQEKPPAVYFGAARSTDKPYTQEELIAILRKYRFDPEYTKEPKRVPFTCLAQYSGVRVDHILRGLKIGRFSRYELPKLSVIVRRFEDGEVIARRWHKRWYVCATRPNAEVSHELRAVIERCPCGRYERCPCGQLPVHRAYAWDKQKNFVGGKNAKQATCRVDTDDGGEGS